MIGKHKHFKATTRSGIDLMYNWVDEISDNFTRPFAHHFSRISMSEITLLLSNALARFHAQRLKVTLSPLRS